MGCSSTSTSSGLTWLPILSSYRSGAEPAEQVSWPTNLVDVNWTLMVGSSSYSLSVSFQNHNFGVYGWPTFQNMWLPCRNPCRRFRPWPLQFWFDPLLHAFNTVKSVYQSILKWDSSRTRPLTGRFQLPFVLDGNYHCPWIYHKTFHVSHLSLTQWLAKWLSFLIVVLARDC